MGQVALVNGYHGTTERNAESILESGFQASENIYDWLGRGVYFFQDAPHRAYDYAQEKCDEHDEEPVVLHSRIRLVSCMDLLGKIWNDKLRLAYDEYARRVEHLPTNKGGNRPLDCKVINYTCRVQRESYGEPIKSVRNDFKEVEKKEAPVFPGSGIYQGSHVQIAVRDMSVIATTQRWKRTDIPLWRQE